MVEQNDDMPVVKQPAEAAESAFAAWDDLIAVLASPKLYAARLAAAQARIAATAEATTVLATEETAFIEHEQTTRAELTAEGDALLLRILAAKQKPLELEARRNRLRDLNTAWTVIGEPPDVVSGFRAPELNALEKARRAHGMLPAPPAAVDDDASAFADPALSPGFTFNPVAGTTLTQESAPRSARARSRLRRVVEPRLGTEHR